MNIDINKLSTFTKRCISVSLSVSFALLARGVAEAISGSDSVSISREGLELKKQALQNQLTAEKSLLLLQLQKNANENFEHELEDFSKKYIAGKDLVEKAESLSEFIPDSQIKQIEKDVKKSEDFLLGE